MNKKTRFLVQGAIIAALYATLTIALAPISYGQIQVRIAEALTILPLFTPAAIPGLFVGVIIANSFGGLGMVDIVFGSLATLSAAYLTHKMPKKWLAPLPPVLINAVVVAFILNHVLGLPLFITMIWVGSGQLIACYGIGYPLLLALEKHKEKIF
ncbi:MAG: transporter [Alkaliphilus sp.]|nr:QueT transporter family protein [bacterium AH-315-G05]MBN4074373.1 QueT transporter family protein [bacterium AH-315-E09]PHS31573.1 MAG: transporter [Alkaliphilus sp.]